MKEKIEKLLLFISPDLQTLKDDCFVIGSSALILSGLPIEKTSDLDLLVSNGDAERLKLLWTNRVRKNYQPSGQDRFKSNFARFDFGELDVEVMGGLTVSNDNKWNTLHIKNWVEVSVGKSKIKIPTLKEQREIFYLFGRDKDKEKAQLIERYL